MNTSNFVNLIGRVGQQPERKQLSGGTELLELSLATRNVYKDRNGTRVEKTDWHRVKCFGPVVDTLERYVNKGDQLSVVGALRYSEWRDKYDQNRKSAEIILDSFSFIGGQRSMDSRVAGSNASPTNSPNERITQTAAVGLGEPSVLEEVNGGDDGLPF